MEAIINYEKNNYGSIKHDHSILIDLRAQRSPMSLQEVNKWTREKQAPQAGIQARCMYFRLQNFQDLGVFALTLSKLHSQVTWIMGKFRFQVSNALPV